MQSAMWLILGATVGLAALVDRHQHQSKMIALGDEVQCGNVRLRLPAGWGLQASSAEIGLITALGPMDGQSQRVLYVTRGAGGGQWTARQAPEIQSTAGSRFHPPREISGTQHSGDDDVRSGSISGARSVRKRRPRGWRWAICRSHEGVVEDEDQGGRAADARGTRQRSAAGGGSS